MSVREETKEKKETERDVREESYQQNVRVIPSVSFFPYVSYVSKKKRVSVREETERDGKRPKRRKLSTERSEPSLLSL